MAVPMMQGAYPNYYQQQPMPYHNPHYGTAGYPANYPYPPMAQPYALPANPQYSQPMNQPASQPSNPPPNQPSNQPPALPKDYRNMPPPPGLYK